MGSSFVARRGVSLLARPSWPTLSSSSSAAAASGRRGAAITTDVAGAPSEAYMLPSRGQVGATQFLALETLAYVDRTGKQRKWDRCVRRSSQGGERAEGHVDAVAVLAVLEGGGLSEPEILLVKQFRPPVGRYTIELPAGLVDDGESPAQAAVRELREETGLVATEADLAAGETVILLHPLFTHIDTPTDERRGCSRMTVSPTARRTACSHPRCCFPPA